jgi:transcriptional regulator with XRE-family HTH domain
VAMKKATQSKVKASPPQTQQAISAMPNAVTVALGLNIKHYREQAQKTQLGLAHDAEIERGRVSKLEHGHINASVMTLAAICHALNITLPQLFEGVTETWPPIAEGGIARRANQAVLDKPSKPLKSNPKQQT